MAFCSYYKLTYVFFSMAIRVHFTNRHLSTSFTTFTTSTVAFPPKGEQKVIISSFICKHIEIYSILGLNRQYLLTICDSRQRRRERKEKREGTQSKLQMGSLNCL